MGSIGQKTAEEALQDTMSVAEAEITKALAANAKENAEKGDNPDNEAKPVTDSTNESGDSQKQEESERVDYNQFVKEALAKKTEDDPVKKLFELDPRFKQANDVLEGKKAPGSPEALKEELERLRKENEALREQNEALSHTREYEEYKDRLNQVKEKYGLSTESLGLLALHLRGRVVEPDDILDKADRFFRGFKRKDLKVNSTVSTDVSTSNTNYARESEPIVKPGQGLKGVDWKRLESQIANAE